MNASRWKQRATALLALLAVAGCVSYQDTTPATPRSAAQLGAVAADVAAVQWPRDDWWKRFADPKLDALVERALSASPQLHLAATRLRRAQAVVAQVDARTQPSIDLSGNITYQHYSENHIYPPSLGGSEKASALLQASGNWELDFFGRNRAALRAALSSEQAAAAEQQAARLLVASQVARTYLQLAHLLDTRDVLAATLTQREKIVELVQARVSAGMDSKVDLRQAEAAVPDARRQIEAINEMIQLERHALAALLGEGPQATAELAPRLRQSATPALPAALPAELIGRRADIVAARWRV